MADETEIKLRGKRYGTPVEEPYLGHEIDLCEAPIFRKVKVKTPDGRKMISQRVFDRYVWNWYVRLADSGQTVALGGPCDNIRIALAEAKAIAERRHAHLTQKAAS